MKDIQKARRKKTKIQTTSARVVGRHDDLQKAYSDAVVAGDIKKIFLAEQTKRSTRTAVVKKEKTALRRKLKEEARLQKRQPKQMN